MATGMMDGMMGVSLSWILLDIAGDCWIIHLGGFGLKFFWMNDPTKGCWMFRGGFRGQRLKISHGQRKNLDMAKVTTESSPESTILSRSYQSYPHHFEYPLALW